MPDALTDLDELLEELRRELKAIRIRAVDPQSIIPILKDKIRLQTKEIQELKQIRTNLISRHKDVESELRKEVEELKELKEERESYDHNEIRANLIREFLKWLDTKDIILTKSDGSVLDGSVYDEGNWHWEGLLMEFFDKP